MKTVKGKQVGLFFGSFNPVHVGHLIIAEFMATRTELDQVWFVVSPHNPLKFRDTLARDQARLQMVRMAIEDNPRLKVSNIEFSLPKPSYTIETMVYMHEKYPQHQFSLIMGGDNFATITKWKNYELLLQRYPIHIYNRKDSDLPKKILRTANVKTYDLPLLNISSTFIRQSIKEGRSIRYMVPDNVWQYLEGSSLYKQ
ncbi:MAG TPA: nicotinate (nicotinamide) nucleotide adenylyltransferase [Saprospiraceae bacterium]|nr:nicotinate (nicotinamide) nucleotide adenylyltransferase [Saprospiraceae bacterium]